MDEHYSVRCSYRFRIDPATGSASPLAVWSPDALKDRILDADVSVSEDTSEKDEGTVEGAGDE
jgi:hypothetical protein